MTRLTALKRGSTAEWRAIARGPNVLHHVLTWDGKEQAWSEDEFYATGLEDWADFRRHWDHYWPERGGACLEIGCGAGRMTRALVRDFDRVVGLDVSEEMIERAGRAAPEADLHRVAGTEVPLADGSVDAVFSVHVLQHLDTLEDVGSYLREARRVLRPGGSLMVHVPLQSVRPALPRRVAREARLWFSRRRLRLGREHSVVRMRLYRIEEVEELLDGLGFEDVELRMIAVRSNRARHHCWLARRPV